MSKFKEDDIVYLKNDTTEKEYRISSVHDYGFRDPPVDSIWLVDENQRNYTSNSNKIILKPKGFFQWMTHILKKLFKSKQ